MLSSLNGGVVVSCQALKDEPLHGKEHMAAMAVAAKQGGALGIRANGYDDIQAIKNLASLPVIGILKKDVEMNHAFITPTRKDAKIIAQAGADIIAVDATNSLRVEDLQTLVQYIKKELRVPVMADISNFSEAKYAESIGCDYIGTTLSGYTESTKNDERPNFKLVKQLVNELNTPIVAEGNIETPSQAKKMLNLGAIFIVVGGAITRPQLITKKFTENLKT